MATNGNGNEKPIVPPANPYTSAPIASWDEILATPLTPSPDISETHELIGGFWRPKPGSPAPEPETTLPPGTSLDEANSLKFALIVHAALDRVSRAILDDESLSHVERDVLRGTRYAYRRVLYYLGFDPDSKPSLEARQKPDVPPVL